MKAPGRRVSKASYSPLRARAPTRHPNASRDGTSRLLVPRTRLEPTDAWPIRPSNCEIARSFTSAAHPIVGLPKDVVSTTLVRNSTHFHARARNPQYERTRRSRAFSPIGTDGGCSEITRTRGLSSRHESPKPRFRNSTDFPTVAGGACSGPCKSKPMSALRPDLFFFLPHKVAGLESLRRPSFVVVGLGNGSSRVARWSRVCPRLLTRIKARFQSQLDDRWCSILPRTFANRFISLLVSPIQSRKAQGSSIAEDALARGGQGRLSGRLSLPLFSTKNKTNKQNPHPSATRRETPSRERERERVLGKERRRDAPREVELFHFVAAFDDLRLPISVQLGHVSSAIWTIKSTRTRTLRVSIQHSKIVT